MNDDFELALNDEGKLECFLTAEALEPTPEERVRQRYLRTLHFDYHYPRDVMRRELAIRLGSKDLTDRGGNAVRADIAVYHDSEACAKRDQGRIRLLVDCSAPSESEGYDRLVSCLFDTGAEGCAWFNGSGPDDEVSYYRRFQSPQEALRKWINLPRFREGWDSLGRRRKSELLRPRDIKGLLRRCHNRLHGRGHDGEEEDLTMDMVRIILAKAQDETAGSDLPEFYCTPEDYERSSGKEAVAARIGLLFDQIKRNHPSVFSEHERITVGPDAIADVVVELQDYRLLTPFDSADDWDIMGQAYEQYTAAYLKRQAGQFFTNRLIVNLLVAMVDPDYDDVVLDPAGGSGGFLTGTMRYVRRKVAAGGGSRASVQRRLDLHRGNLFMVEAHRRLVKVAKTAMILNGDGHAGMAAGNSLGDYGDLDEAIAGRAGRGMPRVILANPPFAGVGEGRIGQADVLRRFECGRRWTDQDGAFRATADLASDGVPPELLFFERCVDWLAPGGLLGIVMPKSFLDTATYRPGREILFRDCRLLAVINCHKNTFQPHTGVRTCLLVVRKNEGPRPPNNYEIFMAISRKIGQDSEGVPILKRDPTGASTDRLDHDLDEILEAFGEFRSGRMAQSGYHFSIRRSDLDENLRINPQMFLPHLNETLESVAALDGRDGWTVSTLGELEPGIRIFKGPRFKSENIIVEEPGGSTELYYTPSALLQERSESAKILDVSRATAAQLRAISAIRVRRGDIVVTRSGSIGRVSFITAKHDGAIVSDDLIRVRIPSPELRHYVFGFLQTRFAQDQMLRNEYGAVQQHLEPEHVRNLLVPVPDSAVLLDRHASAVEAAVAAREELEARNVDALSGLSSVLAEATGSDRPKPAEAAGERKAAAAARRTGS
jgi:type I restriction-modification system DNA methylase subunit